MAIKPSTTFELLSYGFQFNKSISCSLNGLNGKGVHGPVVLYSYLSDTSGCGCSDFDHRFCRSIGDTAVAGTTRTVPCRICAAGKDISEDLFVQVSRSGLVARQ